MANVLTSSDLNAVRQEQREKTIRYNCALSGSYVQFVRGTECGRSAAAQPGQSAPNIFPINTGATSDRASCICSTRDRRATPCRSCLARDNLHWLLVIYTAITTQLGAGTYAALAATLLTDLDIKVEARGRVID